MENNLRRSTENLKFYEQEFQIIWKQKSKWLQDYEPEEDLEDLLVAAKFVVWLRLVKKEAAKALSLMKEANLECICSDKEYDQEGAWIEIEESVPFYARNGDPDFSFVDYGFQKGPFREILNSHLGELLATLKQ